MLEIGNNLMEDALRGMALIRWNRLFIGLTKRGYAMELFNSLVETFRLNGVEPEVWLPDIIAHNADHPINRIYELLPWQWQVASDNTLAA